MEGVFTLAVLVFEPFCTLWQQNPTKVPDYMRPMQLLFTVFFILDIAFNFMCAVQLSDGAPAVSLQT